jgi:hypothetical protein
VNKQAVTGHLALINGWSPIFQLQELQYKMIFNFDLLLMDKVEVKGGEGFTESGGKDCC